MSNLCAVMSDTSTSIYFCLDGIDQNITKIFIDGLRKEDIELAFQKLTGNIEARSKKLSSKTFLIPLCKHDYLMRKKRHEVSKIILDHGMFQVFFHQTNF